MNRYDEPKEVIAQPKGVIAHGMLFRARLGIGEEAYKSLKLSKNLSTFIHSLLAGGAASGAAASSAVAGALFPATGFGSALAAIGIGAGAVTPIGWVVGAGLAAGGAYFGVRKLLGSTKAKAKMVDVVPKYITTPLDMIGYELLCRLLPLGLKIASADGQIIDDEVDAIVEHYEKDWGYSRDFVIYMIAGMKEHVESTPCEEFAQPLLDYCDMNEDCDRGTIVDSILEHLEEILEKDDKGDSARKASEFESLKKLFMGGKKQ